MIDALVKAADLKIYKDSAEPFAEPMPRKHVLIVGGAHLPSIAGLFQKYAVEASVIVPSTLPPMIMDYQFEKAAQFEAGNTRLCKGIGTARDLSGIDSDSVDILIISTTLPGIRDEFLRQAWRVTRELGKVIVFTHAEINAFELGTYGLANPTYFPAESFYVGTMRKVAARSRQI